MVLLTAGALLAAGAVAKATSDAVKAKKEREAYEAAAAREKPKRTSAEQWTGDASAEKAMRDAGARGTGATYGNTYQDALLRLQAGREASAANTRIAGNQAAAASSDRKKQLLLNRDLTTETFGTALASEGGQALQTMAMPTMQQGVADQYDLAKQKRSGEVAQQYAKTMSGNMPPPAADEFTMDRIMGRSPYSGYGVKP